MEQPMIFKKILRAMMTTLANADTVEKQEQAQASINSLIDRVLPGLKPKELSWAQDEFDADISNSTDHVSNKVWQTEDLDVITVIRVFGANKDLLYKSKVSSVAEAQSLIENARLAMYERGLSLNEAMDETEEESTIVMDIPADIDSDEAPPLLTPEYRVDEYETLED